MYCTLTRTLSPEGRGKKEEHSSPLEGEDKVRGNKFRRKQNDYCRFE